MSDQQKTVAADKAANQKSVGAAKGEGGISESDIKFLVECLKNTKGNVIVDLNKVAEALQYNNPKSVGNRLANLKKKYGLAINTSAASAKNSGEANRQPQLRRKKPATPRKSKKAAKTNEEDIMHAKDTKDQDVNMDHDGEDLSDVKEALKEDPSPDNAPAQSREASQCS